MNTTRAISLFLSLALAVVEPAVSQNPEPASPRRSRDLLSLLKMHRQLTG